MCARTVFVRHQGSAFKIKARLRRTGYGLTRIQRQSLSSVIILMPMVLTVKLVVNYKGATTVLQTRHVVDVVCDVIHI